MKFITSSIVIIIPFMFLYLAKGDPSVYGSFIDDLRTETTPTNFDTEAQLWNASGLSDMNLRVYKCGSAMLLGGPGLLRAGGYFQRTYTDLPPHNYVSFIFTFFVFDSWNTDSFDIAVDGLIGPPFLIFNPTPASTCNNQHFEELYFSSTLAHAKNSLTVEIQFQRSSSTTGTFGFGDMKLRLINESIEQINPCAMSAVWSITNPMCACNIKQYSDTNNQCQPCHSDCKGCFGPSDRECYACAEGSYFNGTQCAKCSSTCKTCTGPNPNDCSSCNPGWWYYWNNTCQPSCPIPLINDTISGECSVPCQQNNTFTHWDYYCTSTCDPPLKPIVQGKVNFCKSPCLVNQTFSLNGVCLDECKAPFIIQKINGTRICAGPCGATSDYYFEETQICQPFCDYPYQESLKNGVLFCIPSLSGEEIKTIDQLNSVSNIGLMTVTIGAAIAILLNFEDPGSMLLASLAKMLQYLKFLAIKYPPNLYFALKQKKVVPTGMAFGPKIPSKVQNLFPISQEIPLTFKSYELHSDFFVNNWEFIFTLSIVLILIALSYLLKGIFRRSATVQEKIAKIIPIIKWNLFLAIFCSGCGDIGLYSALEFRTIAFNNFFSILSLIVCLIFNGAFLATIIIIISITGYIQMIKKTRLVTVQTRKLKSFQKKWEGLAILFQTIHNESALQQIYLLIFIIRTYLAHMIVGLLSNYPLAQTIILTVLSCTMASYMIFKMPMRKTVNNIQQIFLEIMILIANVCVMTLSIMDRQDIGELDRREIIGSIINILTLVVGLSSPVFLLLKLLLAIRKYYSKKKAAEQEQQTLETSSKDISLSVTTSALPLEQQSQQINPSSIRFYKSFQSSTFKSSKQESEIQYEQ